MPISCCVWAKDRPNCVCVKNIKQKFVGLSGKDVINKIQNVSGHSYITHTKKNIRER